MEFRQLVIFTELAKQLNFTRTAAALNYTQSNITNQIQALEASLGTPLFDRLGKTVVLTNAGERLLPYATQILDLAANAQAEVSQPGLTGVLSIGAAETILSYRLPPVVQRFQASFPGVELAFKPCACSELTEHLRQGNVHLAFLFEGPEKTSQLVAEPLQDEQLVLVGKAGHRLSAEGAIGLDRLSDEVILLTDKSCPYRQTLEGVLNEAGVRPAGTLEFSNLEAIKRCVAMGVGIAMLPQIVVESELAEGRLVQIPLRREAPTVRTYVAWHKDRWPSPLLRAFLTLVREMCGSLAPSIG